MGASQSTTTTKAKMTRQPTQGSESQEGSSQCLDSTPETAELVMKRSLYPEFENYETWAKRSKVQDCLGHTTDISHQVTSASALPNEPADGLETQTLPSQPLQGKSSSVPAQQPSCSTSSHSPTSCRGTALVSRRPSVVQPSPSLTQQTHYEDARCSPSSYLDMARFDLLGGLPESRLPSVWFPVRDPTSNLLSAQFSSGRTSLKPQNYSEVPDSLRDEFERTYLRQLRTPLAHPWDDLRRFGAYLRWKKGQMKPRPAGLGVWDARQKRVHNVRLKRKGPEGTETGVESDRD